MPLIPLLCDVVNPASGSRGEMGLFHFLVQCGPAGTPRTFLPHKLRMLPKGGSTCKLSP